MASGYRAGGVDFDDLFDPYVQGTKPAATGRRVGGVDLNQRYAPLPYGTKRANVGYRVNGVDVSNLWAAKGTATYSIAGLNGRQIFVGETANTNQSTVSATASVGINNNGQWSLSGGTSKGGATIPAPTSGTWLPAGDSVANYQVQFDVVFTNDANATYTNAAPAYVDCTTSRGASVTLPSTSAANAWERHASLQVRIRIRHKTTLQVISDSSIVLNIDTVGYA